VYSCGAVGIGCIKGDVYIQIIYINTSEYVFFMYS